MNATNTAPATKKTTCAVSRTEFREHAQPLSVTVDGVQMMAEAKEFSTGSLGWYLTQKLTTRIDGKLVTVQVGLNLTLVGSKELPQD